MSVSLAERIRRELRLKEHVLCNLFSLSRGWAYWEKRGIPKNRIYSLYPILKDVMDKQNAHFVYNEHGDILDILSRWSFLKLEEFTRDNEDWVCVKLLSLTHEKGSSFTFPYVHEINFHKETNVDLFNRIKRWKPI